jgi:hypothetical protein
MFHPPRLKICMTREGSIKRKVGLILRSQLTGMLVGLVTTIFFFWLTDKKVEPVYLAVSSSQTDVRGVSSASQVPLGRTVCKCRVAFWNQGKLPLTQDLLTGADPLRITGSKPIRVIEVQTTRTSRPTLHFDFDTHQPAERLVRDIFMNIKDGDALDGLDGGVFTIKFVGACDTQFRVFGRIIGAHPIAYRGEATRTFKYWYATPILIPVLILITIGLTVVLFLVPEEWDIGSGPSPVFALILWILLGAIFYVEPFRQPKWLPTFDLVPHPYHRNR